MDREQQKEKARKRWEQKYRAWKRWAFVVKEVRGFNVRDWQYVLFGDKLFEWAKFQVQYGWKNPQKCSCQMCGNVRRHFGSRTRQEKKFLDLMKDELGEVE